MRIVIIDDSPSDVLLLRLCLERVTLNFDLTTLHDGRVALDFVDAERLISEPTPCLIMLDLHLPKHDGLEVLAAIRCAPPLTHVTVLVMSATPSPQQQARIRELGASYIQKPKTLDGYEQLAALVWELCQTRK